MNSIKEVLARKRDGIPLTTQEIASFVSGVVDGSISDAQASAFLMASCIRGLDSRETAALTRAMTNSGTVLAHQTSDRKRIDKHSTGGVGDKVSLLVAPLAVACGIDVPMISGRGLGHTGGTVDKLESILGFKTDISTNEQMRLLREHHVFMVGQSADIAPADKKLYALRDVTGTVENTGLITASILSKKLAEGIDGLVLDVKVGSAAFMKTLKQAEELASCMKQTGDEMQLPIVVIFSHMNTVLGTTAGNWVEVHESEAALRDVSSASPDLVEVTLECVARMILLAQPGFSIEQAHAQVLHAWRSGEAHAVFHDVIKRQGGMWDQSLVHYNTLHRIEVQAPSNGYLLPLDGMSIARAIVDAGGGRKRETDTIDHGVGVEIVVNRGAQVSKGDTVAIVTASNVASCSLLAERVQECIKTETAPHVEEPSMIIQVWD